MSLSSTTTLQTSLSIKEKILYNIELSNSQGIEIGPLVNPMVRKQEGDVQYIDRATTNEIKKWYSKDKTINIDDIVSIDHVWGKETLAQTTGSDSNFSYCIASHVIEHVPDLVGWLKEIAEVLCDGGVASFSVPDRRYTFDYLRTETNLADLIDAYLSKSKKPSIKQIYDHFSLFTEIDITQAWAHNFNGDLLNPQKTPGKVLQTCKEAQKNNTYIDSHCWVFTATSFIHLLNKLSEMDLLDFRIKHFFDVEYGDFEFVIQLEKLSATLSPKEKRVLFFKSLRKTKEHILKVRFHSFPVGEAQIYYDIGKDFNELDSTTKSFSYSLTPTELEFKIPPVAIKKLRFDPVKSSSIFRIFSMEFMPFSQDNYSLSLNSILPGTHLKIAKHINNTFIGMTYRQANDPHVILDLTTDK